MHPKWPRNTKNREKLPHGIMGRLHNPPLVRAWVRDYFTRRQKQENHGKPMVMINGDLIQDSKEQNL